MNDENMKYRKFGYSISHLTPLVACSVESSHPRSNWHRLTGLWLIHSTPTMFISDPFDLTEHLLNLHRLIHSKSMMFVSKMEWASEQLQFNQSSYSVRSSLFWNTTTTPFMAFSHPKLGVHHPNFLNSLHTYIQPYSIQFIWFIPKSSRNSMQNIAICIYNTQ